MSCFSEPCFQYAASAGREQRSNGTSGQRRGMTLIEVLVAILIFAITVLGLAAGVTSVIRWNQTSYLSTIATNLAQDKLEELKATTSANIVSGGPTTDTVAGVIFTRTWNVVDNSPVAGVKEINVTVTWNYYTSHSLIVTSAVGG